MDTLSETQAIDGVTFDVFQVKLFDRTGKNYATQILYTAIRNHKLMTATIGFDNAADEKRMKDLFLKSDFQ
jgi:hypothetical protein